MVTGGITFHNTKWSLSFSSKHAEIVVCEDRRRGIRIFSLDKQGNKGADLEFFEEGAIVETVSNLGIDPPVAQ